MWELKRGLWFSFDSIIYNKFLQYMFIDALTDQFYSAKKTTFTLALLAIPCIV